MKHLYIFVILLCFGVTHSTDQEIVLQTETSIQTEVRSDVDSFGLFIAIDVFLFIATKSIGMFALYKGHLTTGYTFIFLCLGFMTHLISWGTLKQLTHDQFWIATEVLTVVGAALLGLYIASRQKRIEELVLSNESSNQTDNTAANGDTIP